MGNVAIPGEGLWCEDHWERIKKDENINGIFATILLNDRLLKDEGFMRMCGYDPDKSSFADVTLIPEKMAELAPICCHFGDEAMEEVYLEATKVKGVA